LCAPSSHLSTIDLGSCGIGSSGARALASVLSGDAAGTNGMHLLAGLSRPSSGLNLEKDAVCPSVMELSLASNPGIGGGESEGTGPGIQSGGDDLIRAASEHASLYRLDLSGCSLADNHVPSLATFLRSRVTSRSRTTLVLNGNGFSNASCALLASCCAYSPSSPRNASDFTILDRAGVSCKVQLRGCGESASHSGIILPRCQGDVRARELHGGVPLE